MPGTEYHHKTMNLARGLVVAAALLAVAAVALVPRLAAGGAGGVALAALLGLVALGVAAAAVSQLGRLGLLFELRVRSRFRAVCEHKTLTIKDAKGQALYPRYAGLQGNRQGFRLRVWPMLGQSFNDWERAAPAFAMAYGVTGVRVRDNGDGTLALLVGYQPIDRHEFRPTEALPAVGVSWREQLATVFVGVREGGQPYGLPLIDSHVLVAGTTGAGKGSVLWSLLLRLLPAHQAGVVRFWGFDPKRIELSLGRSFFGDRYAATPDDVVRLLEQAHDVMQARADELAGHVRKFEPSPAHPLHVLVIDELGYLSSLLPDRKLRERAERALSGILVLGRAVGFVVVGALQDPRKETLSYRDLFPTRVAMRLPKPMVDLVLGTGMYEAGAQCDLIPPRGEGAGVAFVVDEGSALPVCVRMAWCSDELIRSAAGELPLVPRVTQLRQVS